MTERLELREQIVFATQRWPIIVLFCLAGSLLGWGISLIWPSPQRATTELYVGLNVSQSQSDSNAEEHAGVRFLNSDDYKNWQMANLNALVYMDEIIDKTLAQLQETDSYWIAANRRQLRKLLHVYWRNAGKWRLVAEDRNRLHAAQAVMIWQMIVVDRVHQAVEAARQAMVLNKQLNELSSALAQSAAGSAEPTYLMDTLQSRREFLQKQPLNQPLNEYDRWSVWQPLAQADLGVVWEPLSEEFPSPDAPFEEYLPWLDRASVVIIHEIGVHQAEIETLEKEKQRLISLYAQASKTSLGLSADLEVERITSELPQLTTVRPTSQLILIGALLGLIVWVGYWLAGSAIRASP